MSTSEPATNQRPKKRCVNCAEEIWADSQYCKSCSTYQNWRRFLPFSQTMLAVVTSCLAVLTVLVPVLAKSIARDDAELLMFIDEVNHLNHPEAGPRLVCNIAMHNAGTKAGIMDQQLQWKITWEDGTTEVGESVFLHPLKERIVDPNMTLPLNAELFSETFRKVELYKMEQFQTHWVHMNEMEDKYSKARLELTSHYRWSPRKNDTTRVTGIIECYAYKRKIPIPAVTNGTQLPATK